MIGRLFDWLSSGSERRSVPREPGEGLVAFYWEGDVPRAHPVMDISRHGAYIATDSISWSRGTQMILTLQMDPESMTAGSPAEMIALQAQVMRTGPGGMAFQFVFPSVADRSRLVRFLSRRKLNLKSNTLKTHAAGRGGSSPVEFSVLVLLLFLPVIGAMAADWMRRLMSSVASSGGRRTSGLCRARCAERGEKE
jgi:hypothetical protein